MNGGRPAQTAASAAVTGETLGRGPPRRPACRGPSYALEGAARPRHPPEALAPRGAQATPAGACHISLHLVTFQLPHSCVLSHGGETFLILLPFTGTLQPGRVRRARSGSSGASGGARRGHRRPDRDTHHTHTSPGPADTASKEGGRDPAGSAAPELGRPPATTSPWTGATRHPARFLGQG